MINVLPARRTPLWFLGSAGFGLVWSAYGVVQFWNTVSASPDAMMGAGMTAEQVAVYAALPLWMNLVFAIGVFGGVIGSALLLLRKTVARPVLIASLAGYVILYIGDYALGVFEAFGPSQVVILTFVVAVAAGLVSLEAAGRWRGLLG